MKLRKLSILLAGIIICLVMISGLGVWFYCSLPSDLDENFKSQLESMNFEEPRVMIISERPEYDFWGGRALSEMVDRPGLTSCSPVDAVMVWSGDQADNQFHTTEPLPEPLPEPPPDQYTVRVISGGVCRDVVFRYNGEGGQVVARGVDWYVMIKR